MPIDAALYIGNIDELLPTAADWVYEGDDQIRATKKAVRQSFPLVSGAVSATHTELSLLAGAVLPVNTLAPLASPTFTGTPAAPTAAIATATTQLATTAFVQASIAFVAASQAAMVLSINSAAAINAASGQHLLFTNVATVTVTLPASPAAGDTVWIRPGNGLTTNIIARNGNNIMSLAEDMTMDNASENVALRYTNSTIGWIKL